MMALPWERVAMVSSSVIAQSRGLRRSKKAVIHTEPFRWRIAQGLYLKEKVVKSRLCSHTAITHGFPASISACIAALISVALLSSTALAIPGDMNCDGAVDVADIPFFVDALLATGSFGGCDIYRADMNADSLIDGRDTQGFVAVLLAPQCAGHFLWCSGGCVDPWTNGGHCGGCGIICAGGQTCQGGVCQDQEPCWDCGGG